MPLVQKNPLTMVGTLDRCWLFAFRTPEAAARAVLPTALEPVTHGGYAFWNVVVSHITKMRPKPSPRLTGMSYWHVGYRLYVRYQPPSGTPIEGLYFTRSDCDSRLMAMAGNIVTDFNFHTAPIRVAESASSVSIDINSPDAPAQATVSRVGTPELAAGSPFASLDEAAAFLKYKPFGISIDKRSSAANIVRIVREESAWHSTVRSVEQHNWSYFAGMDVQPELCLEVDPIEYQWNRGHVYRAAAR